MLRIGMTLKDVDSQAPGRESRAFSAYSAGKKFAQFFQQPARFLLLIAVSLFCLAGLSPDGFAQDQVVRKSDVRTGQLLFHSSQVGLYVPAPQLKTAASIKVSGLVTRVTLTQEFHNPSDQWLEGVYVFPLPENAAVDHLRLQVGKRTLEGFIKKREEAKKIYEAAKLEGKKAALVEQERPNLFTNSVANIGPGERIVVTIEYQHTLRYDQGAVALRFPLAITPRYIPGTITQDSTPIAAPDRGQNTDQVPDATRITPPVLVGAPGHNPVSIKIELDAGFPIANLSSRYHKITRVHHSEERSTINLADETVASDRDFELVWRPRVDHVPQASLFTESDAEFSIQCGRTGTIR